MNSEVREIQMPAGIPEQETPSLCLFVVDDDETILNLAFDILSPHYNVRCAHGGYEALELLEQELCDGMLVDLGMPGMSGLELIAHIRENPRTRHIPIIVMSAYTELRQKVKECEVQAVIGKPFNIDYLVRTVELIVRTNG